MFGSRVHCVKFCPPVVRVSIAVLICSPTFFLIDLLEDMSVLPKDRKCYQVDWIVHKGFTKMRLCKIAANWAQNHTFLNVCTDSILSFYTSEVLPDLT